MSRDPDERGAVAVVVALWTTVLFGLLAIVVDLGLARDGQRQAQTAADSAALAAATILSLKSPDSFGSRIELNQAEAAAVAAAKVYAFANAQVASIDWNGCNDPQHLSHVPDPGNSCISISIDTGQVRVVLPPRASPSVFGQAVGDGQAMVSASACAQWAQPRSDSRRQPPAETVDGGEPENHNTHPRHGGPPFPRPRPAAPFPVQLIR